MKWFSVLLLLGATALWSADAPATVFLVRHAERSGPAQKDPITETGQERAQLLSRMFGEAGITKIFVSDYLRTQQTAAPLAAKLNIEPTVVKGGDGQSVAKALRELPPGSVAFAVRHSGEIEKTIAALEGGKLPAISETEYDRLLIVTLLQGKATAVRTLRYGK